MNSEEIKKTYSMRDILGRYGMQPNRAGFICCPFHKEKTASMKIYQDSYYCFGCGAHGDIFDFVSQMEDITFREAFFQSGRDIRAEKRDVRRTNVAVSRPERVGDAAKAERESGRAAESQ